MTTEESNKLFRNIAIATVVTGVIIFALRVPLTVISIDCFLFTDSLVKLSSSFNPIVMWVILGLFIGTIYGSFVAWLKYRLEFKLNLISIGIFLLFFAFLFLLNKPIQSNATNTFVFKPTVEAEKKPVTHYYYKISTSKSYIYSSPSTQSSVLSKAGFKDIEVEVLEFTNDDWCQVKLYNTTGYIKRKNIVFSRTDPPMQQPDNVSVSQNSTQTSNSTIPPDTTVAASPNENIAADDSNKIDKPDNTDAESNAPVNSSSTDELLRNYPKLDRIKNDLLGKTVTDPKGNRSWRFDLLSEMQDVKVSGTGTNDNTYKIFLDFILEDYKNHERWHIRTTVNYLKTGVDEWNFNSVNATLYERADEAHIVR